MSQEPYDRKVLRTVNRKHDLDVHVSRVTVEDETYVDVREFIPSLQQYGRGILLPLRWAHEIGKAIYDEGPIEDE
jgi:hypothetical protein